MVGHGPQGGLPLGEVADAVAGEGLDAVSSEAGDPLLCCGELGRAFLQPFLEAEGEQRLAVLVTEDEVDEDGERSAEVLRVGGWAPFPEVLCEDEVVDESKLSRR